MKASSVSDAGLGASVYLLEVLIGSLGGPRRWRTMPWAVMLFGVIVVPLGGTSIVLVILQPVAVGAWCTLCLAAAFAMLAMVPLAVDEVAASGQGLARARQAGTLWRTFWRGAAGEPEQPGTSTPAPPVLSSPGWREMTRGVTPPWTLVLAALAGGWVMAAPAVLGTTGPAAASDHLVGAVIVTMAAVAMAEVTRGARLINAPLALWVVAAPWLLDGATRPAIWNGLVTGLVLLLLSVPRGRITERYGRWERYIK